MQFGYTWIRHCKITGIVVSAFKSTVVLFCAFFLWLAFFFWWAGVLFVLFFQGECFFLHRLLFTAKYCVKNDMCWPGAITSYLKLASLFLFFFFSVRSLQILFNPFPADPRFWCALSYADYKYICTTPNWPPAKCTNKFVWHPIWTHITESLQFMYMYV